MKPATLFGDSLDSPLKRFEDIHNYLYANDGLSEQQVLEEMIKMLFVKYYDEQTAGGLFYAGGRESPADADFLGRINGLFEQTKEKYKTYFDERDSLQLGRQSLFFVVSKLQQLNFSRSAKDAGGLAFQKFLGRHAKSGRGQFFTPDPVIDFCVKIIRPEPGEKIIDPACGTGGFLFAALNYIKKNYPEEDLIGYVRSNLFGIEINRKVSQIAKIKFLIETALDPNILCENALKPLSAMRFKAAADGIAGFYDIVLTNPPFGAQGKITEQEMLSGYDLGHKWEDGQKGFYRQNTLLKGQTPDVLFIEQCLNLLKPGGRMGIVLPNSHFENASMDYLREYIKDKALITGVVLLPQETFIPYGTGVRASLLFLRKKDGKAVSGYPVFFSRIRKLGYAGNRTGAPVYKKDAEGRIMLDSGARLLDEDFTKSIDDYHHFLRSAGIQSCQSFSMDSRLLNNRLDYNYYLPANRALIANLKKLNAARLGDIADIVRNKSPLLTRNVSVRYVELSDVYAKAFEIVNSTVMPAAHLPSRASYELKTGDIITAVAGNSIGSAKHATAYVTEEHDGAICTNGFRVLRDSQIDPCYLLYYFQSDLFLKQVFMHRAGAAIPAISDQDFANILIYLSPQREMDDIISKVRQSFHLRNTANKLLAQIKTAINLNRSPVAAPDETTKPA